MALRVSSSEEGDEHKPLAIAVGTKDARSHASTSTGGYEQVNLLPPGLLTENSRQISKLQRQNEKLHYATLCSLVFCAILAAMVGVTTFQAGHCRASNMNSAANGSLPTSQRYDAELAQAYGSAASQILEAAEAGAEALYTRLKTFCFTIGARLSGTPALDRAIDWVKGEMEKDGLEEVRLQRVDGVSHWIRGWESLTMTSPRWMALHMIGLGNSVAGDVAAEVVSVATFEELQSVGAKAKGKIVLFNAPFVSYGETVAYRIGGAVAAARVGAVAAIVRSISSFSMANPHTGAMSYAAGDADNITRIPTAAVCTEHADMIHFLVSSGQRVVLHLKMGARLGKPAVSHNVLAQITGHSAPSEVVTLGGHIDSWDVGLGAMDDGAGLFVTWEAVRLLQHLNLRPKRTVRVVAFTNEEEGGVNGVLGGDVYAREHSNETHVLAIESDSGAFAPEGFYFVGPDESNTIISGVAATLLATLNATDIVKSTFSGTDVFPLHQLYGTTSMELKTEASKYFWYHHSIADTPDKLDPLEMARCAATLAIMAYTIADLDAPLPPSR